MALRIKSVARINPQKPTEAPKYYASAAQRDTITLDALASQISKISSVSRGDIYSVLITLVETMPKELLDGKIVQLGNFGSFALNVDSKPVDTPEQVNGDIIEGAHVVFRPGVEMKDEFKKVKVYMD